jgi:hypothetical protein
MSASEAMLMSITFRMLAMVLFFIGTVLMLIAVNVAAIWYARHDIKIVCMKFWKKISTER